MLIEMDANSKLGRTYILGDPHDITSDGALLSGFLEGTLILCAMVPRSVEEQYQGR